MDLFKMHSKDIRETCMSSFFAISRVIAVKEKDDHDQLFINTSSHFNVDELSMQ